MDHSQFSKDLKKYFRKNDLYKIYDLDRKCTTAQIKKAYKKLSLLYHPDRNDESLKEESKIKFQLISKIHVILSDNDKRKLYDESGKIDFNNFDYKSFENWEDYWRNLYPKISLNEIKSFEAKYLNSDEEREDLKKFYLKFKGDFNKIMENLMFAEICNEDRYKAIINDLITLKEVPAYDTFLKESQSEIKKRKRKAEKENKEFEVLHGSMKVDNLSLAINKSQKQRKLQMDKFCDDLLAKYAPKENKKKK